MLSYKLTTLTDSFYLDSTHRLAIAAFRCDDELKHALSRDVQAYVVGAVVCSVSFLEVSINSLFEGDWRQSSRKTKFATALESVWSEGFDRQPTLAKYQIALALARAEVFDTGRDPYQSAAALIVLRNTISHPKTIISSNKEQKKLKVLLTGRYPFREQDSERYEFFPALCFSPHCAAWALLTAAAFLKEFDMRLPPSARSITASPDAYIRAGKSLLEHGYKQNLP